MTISSDVMSFKKARVGVDLPTNAISNFKGLITQVERSRSF